jgi:hypothetical protein
MTNPNRWARLSVNASRINLQYTHDIHQAFPHINHGKRSRCQGGIEWVAKKPQNTFALTVVIRFDDTTSYEYYIRCKIYQNECLSEKETLTCINNNGTHVIPLRREAGFGLVYSQASLLVNEYIAQDALNEESIGKPVLSVLRSICLLSPNPTVMTGYSLLSEQLVPDASNIAGVLAALSNERQKEIEDILTKYASCLPERDIHRVYAEKVGKLGKDAMLIAMKNGANPARYLLLMPVLCPTAHYAFSLSLLRC